MIFEKHPTSTLLPRLRRFAAVLLLAFVMAAAATAVGPATVLAAAPAAQGAHEAASEGGVHEAGWLPVIAKTFNFAMLAGVLIYFLKAPLVGYLTTRGAQIRQDLVTAKETREAATRHLAEIETRLRTLPAELSALEARGAEEIQAEQVRIEQAADADRRRLLEQARREIEARVRLARRELLEHAADLAVNVARTRVQESMTPQDQTRLLDRYTTQVAEEGR